MVWDSSGYAWFDDGRPRLVQRIKAELEENGKKIDEHDEEPEGRTRNRWSLFTDSGATGGHGRCGRTF